jgi:hypothetical protein
MNGGNTMLKECKLALRITATAYDGELCSLMDAAAHDLTIAGVVLPGTVAFTMTNQGITDTSTLTDALCQRAIFTYVRMHFGSPNDYDRLKESYNVQKTQLMHATGYTDYGETDGDGE